MTLEIHLQCCESFDKWGAFILSIHRTNISTRRQYMAVGHDIFDVSTLAEAGNLLVAFPSTPSVIGVANFGDVLVRKLLPCPIHQRAKLASVDKQHLAAPVAQFAAGVLVARE